MKRFIQHNPVITSTIPEAVESAPIVLQPNTVVASCEYKRLKYINSSDLIHPTVHKYWYNACLLKDGRLFYRTGKEPKGFEDRIATCLLDDDLNVISRSNKLIMTYSNWEESARTPALKRLMTTVFKSGEHVEDPRAILIGNNYFVFYTDGLTIGVAKLDLNCDTIYSHYLFLPQNQTVFKHSDGREKNWIPVVSDNKLYLLYGSDPCIYLECIDEGNRLAIKNVFQLSYSIKWPFGYVRGSAPPAQYNSGSLLWVFHSTMIFNTHAKLNSIHYMFGVYVTENKFPFNLIKVCKLPLLIGIPSHGSTTLSLQHNVVYPCGIIETDSGWRISMGVNDYEIACLDVTERDFLWQL
jgi:predicted GH43/DUF377 family glycosyl hydrolase